MKRDRSKTPERFQAHGVFDRARSGSYALHFSHAKSWSLNERAAGALSGHLTGREAEPNPAPHSTGGCSEPSYGAAPPGLDPVVAAEGTPRSGSWDPPNMSLREGSRSI